MPSIVTQGSEARLLQEGINAIATITYKDYPMEADKIFTTYNSEKAYELDVSLTGMGLASLKPEGGETAYDGEKQDFATTYTHAVYSLGTIITMEAAMNNKYRDLITKAGTLLKRSLVHTDEQLAANVINNAYSSSYPLGDAVSLANTAHVLGKGVEDALIAIEDYRDGAGLLIDARAMSLHIPRQLRFTADRILKSTYEPNSANVATVNPVATIFPNGYHVNHRFTSSTEWFIKTDVDDGFKIFNRMGYTFEQDNDFGTSNYRHKGMFYKSYGVTDPRAGYFSGQ